MKIYIVKEDYTCNEEDASGWNCDEKHDRIVGVSLTLDEAMEMMRRAIADNCERALWGLTPLRPLADGSHRLHR